MKKKLRKENASDIIPRLEALQQAYATLNAEIPQMIRDEVAKAFKVNLNGQLADVKQDVGALREDLAQHNEKHEADMQEIRPYLQFAGGLGVLSKAIVWIGGLALAALAIKALFFGGGPNITSSLQ